MRSWWRLEMRCRLSTHTHLNGQAMCRYSYVDSRSAFLNGYDKLSATSVFGRVQHGDKLFAPVSMTSGSRHLCSWRHVVRTHAFMLQNRFVKNPDFGGKKFSWNQCNDYYRF
jgi:hypothetical protein